VKPKNIVDFLLCQRNVNIVYTDAINAIDKLRIGY